MKAHREYGIIAQLIINQRCAVKRIFEALQCSIFDGVINNFVFTKSYRERYGPGTESDSSKDEYQDSLLVTKGGRCLGLINFQPSYADFLEISGSHIIPENLGLLHACTGIALPFILNLIMGFK